MKKSILNLGKALNKAEQKSINGGGFAAQRLCTRCGYFTPNMRVCASGDGTTTINEPCLPL